MNEKQQSHLLNKMIRSSLVIRVLAVLVTSIGGMIDGIIIGRFLGADSMAAYGLISPLMVIFAAIGGIFGASLQNMCGREIGKGNKERSRQLFSLNIYIMLLLSVVCIVLLYLLKTPVLTVLGAARANEAVAAQAGLYFMGIIPAFPGVMLTCALAPILQIDGKPGKVFLGILSMTVSDVFLDILCVRLWNGNMCGMALATTLSYLISAGVFFPHFLNKESLHYLVRKGIPWKETGEIFKIGGSSAIYRLSTMVKSVALNQMVLAMGVGGAVAALSIQSTAGIFAVALGQGISMAVLAMTSLMYGEADYAGIRQTMKQYLKYGVVITFVLMVLMFVTAPALAGFFLNGNKEVADLASQSIRYLALGFCFQTINIIFMSYLQVLKKLKMSYLICICEDCVFVILSAIVLSRFFGITGVWMAVPVGKGIMTLILLIMAWISSGHFPVRMDDYLFLQEWRKHPVQSMDLELKSVAEVEDASIQAGEFARNAGRDEKTAFLLMLFVEELANNVLEHGFQDVKKHNLEIRIISRKNKLVLRVRDDGRYFDPTTYLETRKKDQYTDFGIKIVMGMAENVQYVPFMGFNSLIVTL